MNFGLTLEELQSGRPIIGIAQTGSDIAPCNRHHLVLAERTREGIREMGGVVFEFPIHPIQETCKRPTASLDRNLQYLSLVEILYGYPILDGLANTEEERQASYTQMAATVPLGRVGEPDEIAKAAVFLASEDSSFVSGIELFVDGGAAQV